MEKTVVGRCCVRRGTHPPGKGTSQHAHRATHEPPCPLCAAFTDASMFATRAFRALNLVRVKEPSILPLNRALTVAQLQLPPLKPIAQNHALPSFPVALSGDAGTGNGRWPVLGGLAAAASADGAGDDGRGSDFTTPATSGSAAPGAAAAGSVARSGRPRRGGGAPPAYNPGEAEKNNKAAAAKLAALSVIAGKYKTNHAAALAYGHGLNKSNVRYWHTQLAPRFDRASALATVLAAPAQPFAPAARVDVDAAKLPKQKKRAEVGTQDRMRLKRQAWDRAVNAFVATWRPRKRDLSLTIARAQAEANAAVGYPFGWSFYQKAHAAALAQMQGKPCIPMSGPVGHPQNFPPATNDALVNLILELRALDLPTTSAS